MSHFKIGSMQACLRSYMKHCHPKHKVNKPRECPPGPLQRFLAEKRSSLSTMRIKRSNYSTRTFSNFNSKDGVKNKNMANFDVVNFEPIVSKGDYRQVLVTLKKRNADGPRGRQPYRANSRQSGVTKAVSAIRLGSFYKDLSLPQKMKRLDMPKLVRYVNPSRSRLDTLKVDPKVQNDSHKAMESISNLLTVAAEKVLRRHDRVNKKRLIGKHIEIPKAMKDQHNEIETKQVPTADELLSKTLRKNIKVNLKNQSTEPLMHLKDCDSSLKTLKNQIQKNPLIGSSEFHAKESEIVTRKHQRLLGLIRKSSSNIKPKIHIKIRGSINIKRNSLGQFKGASQTKVLTTIPKKDGPIL